MDIKETLKRLSVEEKIRLFNGKGSWKTYGIQDKVPSIVMSDGPHGLRKQTEEKYTDMNKSNVATCFPTASCAASSWNRELLEKMGTGIAYEAKNEHVDIVLGPGLNIKRSPLCGRNFEYFSEDPLLSGILAASYVKGMQSQNVSACIKHYACNNQESRRQTVNSIIDTRTLQEVYLRGFRYVIKHAKPRTIMSSYNRVNGKYVSYSKELLTDILRDQMNFEGIVISDWGACIKPQLCLKAGMDLAMPDSSGYFDKCLWKAYKQGIITFEDLEKANTRVLNEVDFHTQKEEIVLDGKESVEKAQEKQKLQKELEKKIAKNHDLAVEIACDSAVLLKNEDNFFPLKKGKVVVIGELAEKMKFQGGGSSHITTKEYPNVIQYLQEMGYEVIYEKGYSSGFVPTSKVKKVNEPLMEEALKTAHKFCDARIFSERDVPILYFCGLTESYEGEGFDRISLSLPNEQLNLLQKLSQITDKIGVVSYSGAPIDFSFKDNVKSILHMYLAGEGSSKATAMLISGKVSPSGHLAESFPMNIKDTPCYNNFALTEDNVVYDEKTLVGYKYYESQKIPVQYEFGFGLSYSKFEYSDFKVLESNGNYGISLKVTNVGKCKAKDVIQLYVKNPNEEHDLYSSKGRTLIELAGFEKVELDKGESKTVEIFCDENTFCVFSCKSNQFEKISGTYELCVGSSVKDIHFTKEVKIKGISLDEAIVETNQDLQEFYENHRVPVNTRGSYDMENSLGDLAQTCKMVRRLIGLLQKIFVMKSKSKSCEDPAVKIIISAICENPLESLISMSGGILNESVISKILRKANK